MCDCYFILELYFIVERVILEMYVMYVGIDRKSGEKFVFWYCFFKLVDYLMFRSVV